MEETKNKSLTEEEPTVDRDETEDLDDLDRFIEKRKIQNEALKKIAGLSYDPVEKQENTTGCK